MKFHNLPQKEKEPKTKKELEAEAVIANKEDNIRQAEAAINKEELEKVVADIENLNSE